MNDLEKYLELPETARLYSEGLALLQRHGLPMYQNKWHELQIGPMGNNRNRLFDTLKKVAANKGPIRRAEILVQAPTSYKQNIAPSSRQELDLLLQLRRQKQQRAKCSQQFHSCDTDAERAEVCTLIEKATEAIRKTEGQIAYLQRHGRLPEIDTVPEEPLPEDEAGLVKLNARLSDRILKIEKRIVFLLSLPETNSKRKKLPDQEKLLHQLVARKTAVRLKRQALKLQQHESKENAS